MIDRVLAASRRAPFQPHELIDQPGGVQEVNLSAVDQRQGVPVEVGLGPIGDLVGDASFVELFPWPLPTVPVARDLADPVGLQGLRKLLDHGLRRERRLDFPQAVQHRSLVLGMGNRQRHGVLGAPGRVHEPDVLHAWDGRKLEPSWDHASLDRFPRHEGLQIAPELRPVLGAGLGFVLCIGLPDEFLRDGGIHRPGVRLPDQDRVLILSEVLSIGPPEFPALRVGAGNGQE